MLETILLPTRDAAPPASERAWRRGMTWLVAALLGVGAAGAFAQGIVGAPPFGPNVLVFDPSMPTAQIKAAVEAVAAQQRDNRFGPQRYALLFKPGTYGSAAEPLNFQVGYYTAVAGLGRSPSDVVVNGSINVYNQCVNGYCAALDNHWRSLSNLTIAIKDPPGAGCRAGNFWAVSRGAPMRRVDVRGGNLTLMDYCTGPSFASGGFIADSRAGVVINGSQQQWLTRDSEVSTWTNGVWSQVFSGVIGAPGDCFPAAAGCGGPYTTLPASPVTREAPYLYQDAQGSYHVFVPALRRDASGTSWAGGPTPGRSIPLGDFFVADPAVDAITINIALSRGKHLLLLPGVYSVDRTIAIRREGTVVLGLGYATLVPQNGIVALSVGDVTGVTIAGLVFDAGPVNSPMLVQVGKPRAHKGNVDNPTALHDVVLRIGGATPGKATVGLEINSDGTILDNLWAWRANQGNGVGWTDNTAQNGLVVNGHDVTAYGLSVDHFQQANTVWRGERGRVIFFANEMPNDPPSQAAWRSAPGANGWPALKVADGVTSFSGWGMGSYSLFDRGVDIYADNAFEVPATLAPGSARHLLTVFLDPAKGRGGILNVINNVGGASTAANPSIPVTVTSYP